MNLNYLDSLIASNRGVIAAFCKSLLSGVVLGIAPLVSAEEADEQSALFEEMPSVFTASRHQQPITKAPASVDIITSEQIKRYGWRTVASMLGSLPGFLATYDRAYSHVGVRGFAPPGDYNIRILVLIDGHRVNENLQDYAGLGQDFPVDVENIERVEVVRGPASSLYGSSALFAVVNVITQRGRDLQGAKLAGEMASYDSHRGQVSLGRKFANGIEALVSASYLHSDGHDNLSFPGVGTSHNLDGEQVEKLFGKASWNDFTLSGSFMQREKQIPTGTTSTIFNDPAVQYHDRRAYADLNYHHYFDHDIDVTGRLFWDSYEFDDRLPYRDQGQRVINIDSWHGQWFGGEWLVSHTFLDHHHVTLGSEYRRNFLQRMDNFDLNPPQIGAENALNSSIYGVYLQDEWTLNDNLHLNLGGRYDHYEKSGGTFNPRLGLILDPWQNTTWKFLYGTAFRAPNAFESAYTCCQGYWVGNKNLRPEKIETYEFVWEQHLNQNFDLRVSPFYNRLSNLIQVVTGPTHYVNGGNAEAHGVETLLRGHYQDLEGYISHTYQQSRIGNADPAPNSPSHMIKFNLSAPIWRDKLFGAVEVQYVSQRSTVRIKEAAPYSRTNLILTAKKWLPGLEVTGGIYNLFDEHYVDPASPPLKPDIIPQDGRNLRIRLSYDF